MDLGRHLHELYRLRFGVVICLVVALLLTLSISYKVSYFPPSLKQRSLVMASASTQVLVDTPRSAVLDLRQDLFEIESMTNRSVLLGNVMASQPVIAYIARRAGVPPDSIRATTPRTPNSPRPFAAPGNERKASDLLASTDQFRLNIEADPSVPVLKIYSQAPTTRGAVQLANAAVDGLRDYLRQVAATEQVAADKQVRLQQLGRAQGAVINGGVRFQVLFLTFLIAFAVSAAAGVFMARVRRGFKQAELAERPASLGPTDSERFAVPRHDDEKDLAIR